MKKNLTLWILVICFKVTYLYADTISLKEIIDLSQGKLYWDSGRQMGYLERNHLRVLFRVGTGYINIGNNMFQGQISQQDNVIFFDSKTGQMIISYLSSKEKNIDKHHVRVILIDAGHGGRDAGAIGRFDNLVVKEKDITLSIALELEKLLKARYPDKTILMTRRDDSYPTLEQRVAIANQQILDKDEAEIYISIHANSTLRPNQAKGFEVWYLPDQYERNVVKKTDGHDPKITPIINSLQNDEYLVESRKLADDLLHALDKGLSKHTQNRGKRQEGWFVVRNAQMAAVLVEVGFVNHEEEAIKLADSTYLKFIAQTLYNGINDFIGYFDQ